jgi:hypothetical protein
MIVEIQNNEILVRFKMGTKASKIQSILDYLKYEELTSKSTATEQDIEDLVNEAKKGRWEKIKKQIGLND